jgi:phage terminase large subunit
MAAALAWCHRQPNPFDAFNTVVLGRAPYWKAQRDICRALADPTVTTVAVPAGHSVGKSYVASGAIVGWPLLHRDAMVVSTGPSNTQLAEVLWKEVRKAVQRSIVGHFGKLTRNPQKLDFGGGVQALGYATDAAERLQGHHCSGPLLVVVDEASGIEDPEIWATLDSLKPKKRLLISNPLRPDGPFYDLCRRAERDPAVRLIRVSSLDSPDIHLEQSPRGLADAAWLREMRADWGEDSLVWRVRVLAQFPDDAADVLIPRAWVDHAERPTGARRGHVRIAVDLAEGRGGDRSVVLVRDDGGVLSLDSSNGWGFEEVAAIVGKRVREFGVSHHRVSWDAAGIGADFGNRLDAIGVKGARAYRGGAEGGKRFGNLRSAAAWILRQRLDPGRQVGGTVQPPFSIRPEWAGSLRPELAELRYLLRSDRTELEPKEELVKRLKRSPDLADALIQSFAFDD